MSAAVDRWLTRRREAAAAEALVDSYMVDMSGLTVTQFGLLVALEPGDVLARDAAAVSGLSPSGFTRAMDGAVRRGHAVRAGDDSDRRQCLCSLTDEGRAALVAARPHMAAALRQQGVAA